MKKMYVVLIIILIILIVWGLIGSARAAGIGTTCEFGLGRNGDIFCWVWRKNIIGDIFNF